MSTLNRIKLYDYNLLLYWSMIFYALIFVVFSSTSHQSEIIPGNNISQVQAGIRMFAAYALLLIPLTAKYFNRFWIFQLKTYYALGITTIIYLTAALFVNMHLLAFLFLLTIRIFACRSSNYKIEVLGILFNLFFLAAVYIITPDLEQILKLSSVLSLLAAIFLFNWVNIHFGIITSIHLRIVFNFFIVVATLIMEFFSI